MATIKRKQEAKKVSNEEYQTAYNNIDNKKIIKAASYKYRKRIDKDTLITCELNALWRCLQYHNDSFGSKFTSSLWKFVEWECQKELASMKLRQRVKPMQLFDIEDKIDVSKDSSVVFADFDRVLTPELSTIIKMKFINGYTLQEIGSHFGYTKEAARLKLNHALNRLRKLVYNTEEEEMETII